MAPGDAHATGRQAVVARGRQQPCPIGQFDLRAFGNAQQPGVRRHASRHAACRVGGGLQRLGAAHDGVGGVNRHIGRTMLHASTGRRGSSADRHRGLVVQQAGQAGQAFGAHRLGRVLLKARQIQQVAQYAQHLPRRAGVAQRHDHAVETLRAAFGIDESAGGFGKRRHRQQHVGAIQQTGLNGRHHHHYFGVAASAATACAA